MRTSTMSRSQAAHQATGQHPSNSDAPPAYSAPTGPPPSWHSEKKQAAHDNDFAPPRGTPPSHSSRDEDYAPPAGPPPSHAASDPDPPPYDPWLAIPDNALLPPPPSLKDAKSPTANATFSDAARAHAWCRQNPLWPAQPHPPQTLQRIRNGHITLTQPPNTRNDIHLTTTSLGGAHVRTSASCGDTIFLSDLPLYTALATPAPKTTIYFELKVLHMGPLDHHGEATAGIAIGFLAPPYPAWRLPGWERASVGVHGDDGRRYADDSYGGQEFTAAFRVGEVVGIGMTVSPSRFVGGRAGVEVFFTRDGRKEGGWDLHEERDSEQKGGDLGGLEGGRDVLAAVGCFGAVEFEARFRREEWLFRP
ncbi:hypothetical protein B0A55_03620 [Friedmanniomyces simplex]|uniref:SPRY domain-containing protein n=1 Tax=Friedmanniomyces simplex TaxID=329884 RepID=A0A4U0XSA8_9PEZI|nr:hypothetical protein B0A55_03620 [Friedmanniomyces simplex]